MDLRLGVSGGGFTITIKILMWNVDWTITVPIVVSAKGLVKKLKSFVGRFLNLIQKTVILDTARIVWRFVFL